uniref:Uncharacterized protein n=1 Tax=Hyaloperonospora arabidopsidis (strain Emoy2) TaxID=559515 RepID=M4B774_HYAAE
MDDSGDQSITCPVLPEASSSSPPAAVPLRSPSSFPSGRVSFLPAINRRTLRSYIDDLYDCAEARQYQLTDYIAIHDRLRAQEIRGDRSERQLRDVQEFAGPIRQSVNKQYNNLRDSWADAEQKIAEFQEELADQEERLQEIPILKFSLLKLKAARHDEQEKHRCQLAILQNELKSVIASSKDADDQAKLKIENAKTRFAARQPAIMRE